MRILYTHTASLIGGGNKVLLNLFATMPRTHVQPFSVVPEPGPIEDELRSLDVPYIVLDLRPRSQSRTSILTTIARLVGWCLLGSRWRTRKAALTT